MILIFLGAGRVSFAKMGGGRTIGGYLRLTEETGSRTKKGREESDRSPSERMVFAMEDCISVGTFSNFNLFRSSLPWLQRVLIHHTDSDNISSAGRYGMVKLITIGLI